MAQYDITRESTPPTEAELVRLLSSNDFHPMPRAAERDEWERIAKRPWVQAAVPGLIERAQKAADAGPSVVRATDYLSFYRTGLRDAHNASAGRRSSAISALALSECLQGEGLFLDALLDWSWAAAEETSWIMPPHLQSEGATQLPDPNDIRIDLGTAGVGRVLSEIIYLLGAEMDAVTPMWRKRINFSLRRQVIDPFLNGSFWWETTTNNWNAVCNAGMVATALMGGFEVEEQARVLHKAIACVPTFLRGFTEDGGCTEGPGYWAYGVSNYAALAFYLDAATGGAVDLLADPLVRRVFEYPAKMVLSGRKVAAFADCPREVGFRSGLVAWAAERLDLPGTLALASGGPAGKSSLRSLLDPILLPEPCEFRPPAESFLPDLQVLVARGDGEAGRQLVLAVKGGHNNEHHNHNDVGAFIVHWLGESVVCDLGAGEYIKQLFSDTRYELLSTRGCGHNVPIINGVEQKEGREFCATDFRPQPGDGSMGVSMELATAYPPEAGLTSLERRVTLDRSGPECVEMVDRVQFAGEDRRYELPLFTEGTFEAGAGGTVTARSGDASMRIEFDPDVVEAAVEMVEHGDGRFGRHFGDELPRCTLRLVGDPAQAEVRIRFSPSAGQ